MLIGYVEKQLDSKNRLSIPKKFRDFLTQKGDNRLALLFLDNCIQIYPWKVWEEIEKNLKSLPFYLKEARYLQRFLGKLIDICEIDKDGRVIINQKMRDLAGIKKDIVIIGAITRVEVWAKERYEAMMEEAPKPEELADKVFRDVFK